MSLLLGVDCGLTAVKVVLFNESGYEVGMGSALNVHRSPAPHQVEQDPDELWNRCAQAIRAALNDAGGGEVVAVGLSGFGDGVFLLDRACRPVRPAILSLDSRAQELVDRWNNSGLSDELHKITGQRPFPGYTLSVLAWLKENEPEALSRARWVLWGKDWLRYRLTGELATDPTERSSGFAEVRTGSYPREAAALCGLEEVEEKLPPVAGCAEVAGEVTPEAAESTGLAAGTPVVTGCHDIDASAIGTGCIEPGPVAVIAGTWCNNEVVSEEVVPGERWICRRFVLPGRWLNVSGSPASATNLEWFVRRMCPAEVERARKEGRSPYDFVSSEVSSVMDADSTVFYHPFLYGSPYGSAASGAFFGLRGWHTRAHLLRAVLEGITFNHRYHVEALAEAFETASIRLTGGGARSPLWSQMFADVLSRPVEVTAAGETGALGAALLAGIGAGLYSSLEEAVGRAVRVVRTHEPEPAGRERLARAYKTYTALAGAIEPLWPCLEGEV
ncbi:MAG: carbohydrate kinase [Rubrobacteraceae bacterium]|nr:carbohydrate kinase [Rubrobacteraceae bacterium]